MEKEHKPKIRVTILPDVYDPGRYRRGMAVLRSAICRAVASQIQLRSETMPSSHD